MPADGDRTRGPVPDFASAPAAGDPPRRFVSTRVEVEGREEVKVVEVPAFEPAPWDDDADLAIVGRRATRVDALEKVTGRAHYTTDVHRPGTLHAAIVRAPLARGRLATLDLLPALAVPGVRDAIARADIPAITVNGFPLLDGTVRYAGQPVAAVVADTADAARRGAAAVRATYVPDPHAVTAEQALAAGAPVVRGAHGNRTRRAPRTAGRGDVGRGIEEAAVVVEREYRVPCVLHTALEPHGAVAEWTGEHLTVWESTQGIFNTRADLAEGLALPLTSVRVVKDYMGGGFGAKNGASTNAFLAALLARRTGRPVACINDREGEQMDSGNRAATITRVTLGATREGRLTAIRALSTIPLGIDGWEAAPGKIYHQMYACPNVETTDTFVWTNTGAMSSFRAPGHVEGAFGLERAMDALARELGIDPLELRRRNHAARDEEKGRDYTGKRLLDCYRLGAERFEWEARESRRGPRDGPVRRGFGVASQTWGGGGGPPAYALVRLNADGTADVLTGSQDLGTGTRTVLAQVAAEALGARLEDVRVVLGDTERTPYTGNSWGSMTVPSVAPAVRMAAEDARAQLLEAAAGMLGAEPGELTAREGAVAAPSGDVVTIAAVMEALGDVMIVGKGTRAPNPDGRTIATFGAQFAEVEVDVETGRVRVLRVVAAHDSGRILNPTLAESQVEGGIIQGLGYALFEERVLDERLGLPLNPTMHDYKIPVAGDVPRIETLFVGAADAAANHTGAKGLGEPPIIPAAPAIANAVADALGVEVTELPLTPWRVLAAIREE
jgi:xanthine dehydrogenase YagR molybdenum-binding subunit